MDHRRLRRTALPPGRAPASLTSIALYSDPRPRPPTPTEHRGRAGPSPRPLGWMVTSGAGIGGSLRPEPAGPPLAAREVVLGRGDRVIVTRLERFEQAPLSAVDLGGRPFPLRRRLLWHLPAVPQRSVSPTLQASLQDRRFAAQFFAASVAPASESARSAGPPTNSAIRSADTFSRPSSPRLRLSHSVLIARLCNSRARPSFPIR